MPVERVRAVGVLDGIISRFENQKWFYKKIRRTTIERFDWEKININERRAKEINFRSASFNIYRMDRNDRFL